MKKSISLKIFSIALLFMLLMAVVSGFSTFSLKNVSEESRELSSYYLPVERHAQWAARDASAEVIYFDHLLTHKRSGSPEAEVQDALQKMQQRSVQVDQEINAAMVLVEQGLRDGSVNVDPDTFASLKHELPQIIDAHAELRDTMGTFISEVEMRHADPHTIVVLNSLLEKQRDHVAKEILDVTNILDTLTRESAAQVLQQERQVLILNWAITLLVSMIGLGLAWFITRSLVRPLHDLLTGTRKVQAGDLTVKVEVTSTDEVAALTDAFNHMITGLKQKEEIQRTFGHYVDPRIVKNLIEDGGLTRGGERKNMTIFFSDLEGFTSLCEQIQPDLAVKFLNQYFDQMAAPILANSGIIDKYIGDSIMAYWGPPFSGEADHALLACEAALEQERLMDAFRKAVPDILGIRRNVPHVRMRIGISTGDVTIGNVGSSRQKGYTVIGDSVNLAARLESANKQYGTRIIMSEQTWQHVHGRIETRELDSIRVIGKVEPVRIFEALGRKGEVAQGMLELRDLFAEALNRYRAGDFDRARALWSECARLHPEDPATKLFLARLDQLGRDDAPAGWDGVWTMSSK
jgi:adenylate cyclase